MSFVFNALKTLEQASECVLIADRWRQSGPTFEAYSKLMKQQSKDVYNYTYGDQVHN